MLPPVREPIIPYAPPHYICRRSKIAYPGEPDGKLEKAFWEQAALIDDFHDIEGDSKPRPLFKTEARMLWDDDYLYVGAKLWGNEIWASVTGRDEVIFVDNDFEVFISPKYSSHRYYEIELNAYGSIWDLFMEKPQRDVTYRINGWDVRGLRSAVHIEGEVNNPKADNKYWSLELLIPWKTVREAEPGKCLPTHIVPDFGEIWRMDFSRVQYRVDVVNNRFEKRKDASGKTLPEFNWLWAPTGVIDAHMPEMWAFVVFGDENTEFAPPADDRIYWELRKLYYRQRNYGAKNGYYTENFDDLRGGGEWAAIPKIDVTPNLFEISMPAREGSLHIRQDGLVWMET